MAEPAPEGRAESALAAIRVYTQPRVAAFLFLGFASGLPLALTGATLAARLERAGVSLTEIGLISLVGLAYSLKFFWAPVVDRVPLPLLTRWLGLRRGWMLLSQLVLAGAIFAMALTNPAVEGGLGEIVFWAVVVAFASATQDIAVDAYRTEILDKRDLGAGAANHVFGYRIALLVAVGGALSIAEFGGWFLAYAAMALLVPIGIAAVFLNPEPAAAATADSRRLESVAAERLAGMPAAVRYMGTWFYGAVVCPFAEFMTRPGWLVILLFVTLYKYGDALLGIMATPFYLRIGFSLAEVGVIGKFWGFIATVAGFAIAGWMVARHGILKSLLICGFLQAGSNIVFAWQAWVGYSVPALFVTIGVENLTGGMGTIAFVAYLSSLCDRAYTATQYALLSSLAAAARTALSAGGGWLADQTGWLMFFLITILAAVPGLVLLIWIMRRYPDAKPRPG